MLIRDRIDTGLIEANDRAAVGPVAKRLAVASRDVDLVADCDIFQINVFLLHGSLLKKIRLL